ncbi:MAG: NAD(P)H-binding protein [Niabella sp.]
MRAVLIGATGATGSELLKLLLDDNAFSTVTVLVRRPLDRTHEKLQAIVIDFNKPEQWADLVKGAVAFSCLGTTLKAAGSKAEQYKVDYGYQLAFANAARANGVPKFILISAGMANPKSQLFYARMKGALEHAIGALDFPHLFIFRPGLLSRPGTERAGERISASVLLFLNKLGLLKRLAPLPVARLARLMLFYAKNNRQRTVIIEPGQMLNEIKNL